ncbi:caspase-1-A-like isoform X2 [Ostrea edulis]|uniref:caspase-1-A-like isoform X2 n=1 Tax=Ostrea edulis TaxID=37623 RepID=UPI0020947951|nr:caspase-1-A-like isoform X2 [Ostrea edulis]
MWSTLDADFVQGSDRESSGDRREVHETELGPLFVSYIDSAVVPTEDCNIVDNEEKNEFVVVDNNKPGLALLVGFEYFNNGEQSRPGVKKDLENMYELFHTHLGFEVQVKKDLTAEECMEWIREVTSKTELLQRISCVVMVISSHGSEDEVKSGIVNPDFRRQEVKFYQHRFSTKDGSIQTSEIIDKFDDGKCRALKGKPKVFFIQACRSRTCENVSAYDVVDGGVSIRIQPEGSSRPHPSTQHVLSSQNRPVMQNEEAHSHMDAKGVKCSNIRAGNKIFTEMSGCVRAPMEEEVTLAPPPCLHNCMIVMASPPVNGERFVNGECMVRAKL